MAASLPSHGDAGHAGGSLTQFEADLASNSEPRSADGRSADKQARARFVSVVGESVYESWRETCENWQAKGMYQYFARSSTAVFKVAWARRWVAMRAHQFGWSEALHGNFDSQVRQFRESNRVEPLARSTNGSRSMN
jgi:hypothetical protein